MNMSNSREYRKMRLHCVNDEIIQKEMMKYLENKGKMEPDGWLCSSQKRSKIQARPELTKSLTPSPQIYDAPNKEVY